ncbi:mitotic-spindle organizing protein 2 isoform X4 [Parasteatoda tepidariorum]|uniref:mitotic-spindle organizing protein 2 isoform X4 n=1 Tax=Parasteatoda tepidariorum TaxID=114398 RepID=UPI0039BD2A54
MTEGRQQQTSKQHQFKKLADEDLELYQLAQLSGIIIDPHVFHILLELLRLDVCPIALFDVLQDMSMQFQKSSVKKSSDSKSSTTHTSSGKKKPPVAAKPKKIKNSYTESSILVGHSGDALPLKTLFIASSVSLPLVL